LALSPPALIAPEHDVSQFLCQHTALTEWLQKPALDNGKQMASQTRVVCDGVRVVGYYALAAGSVAHEIAPKPLTRNMPKPIPAIVLGRLAVDTDYQGKGIGAALLKDATLRALAAAREIGARVLLCHAIDDAALKFYLKHGFLQSPAEDLAVMLDLGKTQGLLDQAAKG
jgi:GNAT superfamily N-acetyltransferase